MNRQGLKPQMLLLTESHLLSTVEMWNYAKATHCAVTGAVKRLAQIANTAQIRSAKTM